MEEEKLTNKAPELTTGKELSEEDLSMVAGGTGGSTDEMSLKLQMAMDGQAQITSTLSNIMKSASSSQNNIINNLK
jgi:hypothetical protein